MLKNFLVLFLLTFFICIFILLMQFVWMHVQDLVGKGVEVGVLAEFFVYAVASVVPLALPLAILLASLISFGNLGEKFELTAMKAAGISLFRIMRPLTIAIAFICVGAFFFSNYVLPVSQVKLWALIFSLRQKSPELDIPAGEFYDGISGYNIYVRKKNPRSGKLEDLMIYDYSKGFKNATVMVADSGKILFTDDNRYLVFCLYSGESFENINQQQQRVSSDKNVPYRRETFKEKQILVDFNSEFNRYDESVLDDQHVSKNAQQLLHSIDSVHALEVQKSEEQSQALISTRYFGREQTKDKTVLPVETEKERTGLNTDSIFSRMSESKQRTVMTTMVDKARQQQDAIAYNALLLQDYKRYITKHEIELHRKFTLAFACLIFFFIGAPLGAIIRKGGLGAPVVISVIMFIVYYIIDTAGYKMAREALWPCWQGMWLSSFVLLPIGIFLTYKAATDSALLNPEAWVKVFNKVKEYILNIKDKCIQLKKRSKTLEKVNS
ncbi:MAG: LptF/LptG family permease [Paludibacteraceae bacterium]|nr:LptF/LptG family permease [Paludibacteraceae bacterium]